MNRQMYINRMNKLVEEREIVFKNIRLIENRIYYWNFVKEKGINYCTISKPYSDNKEHKIQICYALDTIKVNMDFNEIKENFVDIINKRLRELEDKKMKKEEEYQFIRNEINKIDIAFS